MSQPRALCAIAALTLSGCLATPRLQGQDSDTVRASLLSSKSALPVACAVSIEDGLDSELANLARVGIRDTAKGLLFVSAGDSYLWLELVYIGPVGDRFEAAWSRTGEVVSVSERQFEAALRLASASPVKPPREGFVNDHNHCEFLLWPNGVGHAEVRSAVGGSITPGGNEKQKLQVFGFDALSSYLSELRNSSSQAR